LLDVCSGSDPAYSLKVRAVIRANFLAYGR
jgi:hypothetical protein